MGLAAVTYDHDNDLIYKFLRRDAPFWLSVGMLFLFLGDSLTPAITKKYASANSDTGNSDRIAANSGMTVIWDHNNLENCSAYYRKSMGNNYTEQRNRPKKPWPPGLNHARNRDTLYLVARPKQGRGYGRSCRPRDRNSKRIEGVNLAPLPYSRVTSGGTRGLCDPEAILTYPYYYMGQINDTLDL